ncbi:Cullin-associated NEDD8-dissociated protein 1 [Pelomyxa schiedti]|nr:Cullin-associated NEDD8-dissociated protein 1 [Pelomyxa schiedti]
MSFSYTGFYDKCANRDNDYRDMAGRDLARELEKDTFKIDPAQEKKVVDSVMQLLKDTHNNVQEQAIKCIGPLVKRVDRAQTERIVLSLMEDLIDPRSDDSRDTVTIALRNIINDLPLTSPVIREVLLDRQAPKLIQAVTTAESQPIKMAALEILTELIRRFGRSMNALHKPLLDAALKQVSSSSSATQKRAITCLGQLVVVVPDNLFTAFMQELIRSAEAATRPDNIRTNIQCLGVLSHSVGNRFGPFLARIVPYIAKHTSAKASDQETRENCFSSFTSLAVYCPKQITPFLPNILELCFQFVSYEPLFDDGDAADADMEEEPEEEEEPAEDEEDEVPDDDDNDVVYRVRKGAVKTLGAVFQSHPEVLVDLPIGHATALIGRVKGEKVEDVKLDLLQTLIAFIKAKSFVHDEEAEARVSGLFAKIVTPFLAGLARALKSRSAKVKAGVFPVLKELNATLPGCLGTHFGDLVPAVIQTLEGGTAPLKIHSLSFLWMVMETYPPATLQPQVAVVAPHLFKTIVDPMNRVAAEALHLATAFVHVIRPEGSTFDFRPFIEPLYTALVKQANSPSSDQEVKECAMVALGHMVAAAGDAMPKLGDCLKLLVSKLSGEVARTAVVKVIPLIIESNKASFAPHLNEILHEMSLFLKKIDKELQDFTVLALIEILKAYGRDPAVPKHSPAISNEIAVLISTRSSDLFFVSTALNLAHSLLKVQQAAIVPAMQEKLIPQTLKLIEGAMLQGAALQALLQFYSELVKTAAPALPFQQFLESVMVIAKGDTSNTKQVATVVAECVGAIVSSCPNTRAVDGVITQLVRDAKTREDNMRTLALLFLGQVGKRKSLAGIPTILQDLFALFSTGTPESKHAAAMAIGGVALGNLETFLPFVLEQMSSGSSSIQRLLLVSLREIVRSRADTLKPHVDQITRLLFRHCDADDVATRDTVAEVLGKLAATSGVGVSVAVSGGSAPPQSIIAAIADSLESRSSGKRGTMVAAIRFALSEEHTEPIIAAVAPHVAPILNLISYAHDDKTKQLGVRERALQTVRQIAANHPKMLRGIIVQYLGALYAELPPKKEYISIVDLGFMKVTVDDALAARKDAYEIVALLCKSLIDKLDMPTLIRAIQPGLTDVYDIRNTCCRILNSVMAVSPASIFEALDIILPPLVATTKEETKKTDDALHEAEIRENVMSTIANIIKLPNSDNYPKLAELLADKQIGEALKKLVA